jgi:uncharacterized membrane protein
MLSKSLQNSILNSDILRFAIPLFTGLLVIVWLLNTPPGLLGKTDAIGYAVCHRIDLRSFHIADRPISLCARCTGQYLGALVGIVFQLLHGRRRAGRPSRGVIGFFILFVILYGIDGLNSYLHLVPELSQFYLYEPNNTLRMVTGTGMGLSISAVLLPIFHQTVWSSWDRRPALDGVSAMILLLIAAGGVNLLVLLENPIILYPLTLISSLGVIVLLTIVFTIIGLMVVGQENRIQRARQLILPIMVGFMMAMIQIALLDFVRYFFTGTWDGFHLG